MPADPSRLFVALRNNGLLKLVALGLAVAAWYGIRKATSFEALIKDVPLRVRVDEGWAILDQSVANVDVLFSGSLVDLRNINRDDILVEIDRRGESRAGSSVTHLSHKNVRNPGGARPIRVDPADVRVSLDRESDKLVPVKADIVGHPPEGFEVERVVCTPATVVLRGPQRRLDEVDLVKCEPIEMEGRIRSFQLNKAIQSPADNWSARIEPNSVRVEVVLVERSSRKDLADVPIRALSPPDSRSAVHFSPSRVAVTLEGGSQALEELESAKVLAFVDCGGLQEGGAADLPVRILPGAGIRVVAVDPPVVKAALDLPESGRDRGGL
jgi:YbbR domain-containing protein